MMVVPLWVWGAFVAFILLLLVVDLFVFHREAHAVNLKEAATWSTIWIVLGVAFTGVVWWWMGSARAGEYIGGYVLEKALSVDNMFVFALIFGYFGLPRELQHRVLFWGIVGALIFRAAFIFAGAALLENFEWMIFVFGGFLVVTGIRMALHQEEEIHPERNPVLKAVRRLIPMSSDYHGQHFLFREGGRLIATPLVAVLVVIETTDIIFAVDSIPAIFAVTDVPFLVFSSNAFAILGLRALFFVLAGMMHKFRYLKVGLSVVLVFIGLKMAASEWYHMPIWISLSVIAFVLTVSVVVSLLRAEEPGPDTPLPDYVAPVDADAPTTGTGADPGSTGAGRLRDGDGDEVE